MSHYYATGAENEVDAPDLSAADTAEAQRELARMKRSLRGWLKFRCINDQVAAGERKARISRAVAAKTLPGERDYSVEQRLAYRLHALLSEVFDPAQLPDPDLANDANAAVRLAGIAICGKLPSEAPAPGEQGFIFLWPLAIVAGAGVLLLGFKIRTDADVAKEKEHIKCIRDGACTDYGFWLKTAAVLVVGWVIWDKAGLGERVTGYFDDKKKGAST